VLIIAHTRTNAESYIAASSCASHIIQVTDSTVLRAKRLPKFIKSFSTSHYMFRPTSVIIRRLNLLMNSTVLPFFVVSLFNLWSHLCACLSVTCINILC
jgi:hypothetical protein